MAKSEYAPSDHYDGELFFNPSGAINKTFRDLLR